MVGLTNSSGAVVNSYAYDPYGNATSVSEQVSNPFRYIGAIWDASTGLYKMGERYYDPSVGRFTQLDPLGTGYAYAGGDPINFSDPSGLSEEAGDPMTNIGGAGYGEGDGSGYESGGPGDEGATADLSEPIPVTSDQISFNTEHATRGGGRLPAGTSMHEVESAIDQDLTKRSLRMNETIRERIWVRGEEVEYRAYRRSPTSVWVGTYFPTKRK
ncbi:MAG TPA: RHS repeat-associated core domain-containing protein [Chloroflexota bacterium]|nr:RHS repeat-associated core domain-containing protein [Chloroflexota bacterium]